MSEETKTGRRLAGRSPGYPGVPLRLAIERAHQLYRAENRHPTPVPTAMAAWGYTNPNGGNAGLTLAALKKYGLLIEEKVNDQRVVRISDLAFEIIRNPDPQQAIRKAALTPPIFREMWEKYGVDLPSDHNMRWQLEQRGFTPSGATEFLKVYRETVAYAQLDGSTPSPSDDEFPSSGIPDAPTSYGQPSAPPSSTPTYPAGSRAEYTAYAPVYAHPAPVAVPTQVHGMRMPLRLAGGEVVYLEGEFPITEAAFQNLLQILQVMKPGLVAPDITGIPQHEQNG